MREMAREGKIRPLRQSRSAANRVKVTEVKDAAGDLITIFGGLNGHFLIEELQRGARGTMPGSDMTEMFVSV